MHKSPLGAVLDAVVPVQTRATTSPGAMMARLCAPPQYILPALCAPLAAEFSSVFRSVNASFRPVVGRIRPAQGGLVA